MAKEHLQLAEAIREKIAESRLTKRRERDVNRRMTLSKVQTDDDLVTVPLDYLLRSRFRDRSNK